ncbi:Glutathione synthetase [Zancudomyces culisetae]|uniref:Glutathione synthetase n=1 Tax=Zancudomyces culisetae TaxID=1213189 RepID=A0A1R1PTW5_ZANCU|nr:Glutathione synthetase [Zancudomyces culisetae]|eukprot:OMH84435.1 Glutathione synthetase [Zancudomyces culisetae]
MDEIKRLAYLYLTANGVLMKRPFDPPRNDPALPTHYITTAPVSLVPGRFDKAAYERAVAVQPYYNRVYNAIGNAPEFLRWVVEELLDGSDPFITNLYAIYVADMAEYGRERIQLNLNRSDYLEHINNTNINTTTDAGGNTNCGGYELKQVEFNTVSVSFASFAQQVSEMHRFLVQQMAGTPFYTDYFGQIKIDPDQMPDNSKVIATIAEGLFKAATLYSQEYCGVTHENTNTNTAILLVEQENEHNVFDQQLLEITLWRLYGVKTYRKNLMQIHEALQLPINRDQLKDVVDDGICDSEKQQKPRRRLFIENTEISVVYFRSCYTPKDFIINNSGDGEDWNQKWQVRKELEHRLATKVPNVGYQLAGMKKVQQILTQPGILTRFLGDDQQALNLIESTFMRMYSFDSDPQQVLDTHIFTSNKDGAENNVPFVLKPQREGGGGFNIYGKDIEKFVAKYRQQNSDRQDELYHVLKGYILMELINVPKHDKSSIFFDKDNRAIVVDHDSISELGIFGVYLSIEDGNDTDNGKSTPFQQQSVVINKVAGHLLRSKSSNENEGGVAAGFAVLDSPILF